MKSCISGGIHCHIPTIILILMANPLDEIFITSQVKKKKIFNKSVNSGVLRGIFPRICSLQRLFKLVVIRFDTEGLQHGTTPESISEEMWGPSAKDGNKG